MACGKKILKQLVGAGIAGGVLLTVPWRICAVGSAAWYADDPGPLQRLANGVERLTLNQALSRDHFITGCMLPPAWEVPPSLRPIVLNLYRAVLWAMPSCLRC